MKNEGRFWPTEQDRQPLTTNFHVARSSVLTEPDKYVPGTTTIQVTEGSQAVDERLRKQFPVYRFVKWGSELLSQTGRDHEV